MTWHETECGGWRRLLSILIVTMLLPHAAYAEAATKSGAVTLDWLFSPEAQAAQSVSEHIWLTDGTALLITTDVGGNARIDRLNPETGRRSSALNVPRAVASLRSVAGAQAENILPAPDSVHSSGGKALYTIGGDVYVLDISSATFTRVTTSPEKEGGARFSPDGSRIAFVRANDIWIYDLRSRHETRLTFDGSQTILNGALSFLYEEDVFPNDHFGLWWSPDSKSLAFLRSDVSQVSQLQYVDIAPFNPRVITQRYALAGEPICNVRVGVLEIGQSRTVWAEQTGIADQYIVHVDWLPDSSRLTVQVLNRNQDQLRLNLIDRATGQARPVLEERDPAWVNISDDLYFLADGRRFIWGSERDGHKHLYLYGLDGKLIHRITTGPWSVRGPDQVTFWWGKSVVHLDERAGWVYFTALEKSSQERHLYRIRLDGSGMRRLTREEGFHSVAFSPRGGYYLDRYSRASRLPSLSLHRADGVQTSMIEPPRDDLIASFSVHYPQFLSVPATDGVALPAQLWKPATFDPAKRYPVIIHHYGGPQAPMVVDRWQNAALFNQLLLERGYLVFSVDNRSATAISKTFENTILRQGFGAGELSDLLAAVHWLKSQPWVDPSRIGMWGWSYGGGFTLLGMTRSQEFKAGIAVGAPTDNRFHEARWAEFAMKRPQDNWAGYEEASFLPRAKDLHGRLMIMHGTYDDNVRVQNAWAFMDALIAAGKDFDMVLYPMRDHFISDPAARRHQLNKMLDFWDRNL